MIRIYDPGPEPPKQTRGRRDTSGRMAPGDPIDSAARYWVGLWDHVVGDFAEHASGLRLMELRAVIREVEEQYDPVSYCVEREYRGAR